MDYSEKGFSKSQSFRKIEVKNDVQWNSFKTIRLNLSTFCPRLFKCLKKDRSMKLRVKAYKHILKEISIENIIKRLRVLKEAFKEK